MHFTRLVVLQEVTPIVRSQRILQYAVHIYSILQIEGVTKKSDLTPSLTHSTDSPDDVEYQGGVCGQHDLIPSPKQIENKQHHHADCLGVQAHLRLFDDHPVNLLPLGP